MRLLSLSEVSIQPRTNPPKSPKQGSSMMQGASSLPARTSFGRWKKTTQKGTSKLIQIERFVRTGLNIELNHPQNFERLVLGCTDSYDSESRRIFQHFPRSTRFKNLCTAPNSKFCKFSTFFKGEARLERNPENVKRI